jgi:hypothetical protein
MDNPAINRFQSDMNRPPLAFPAERIGLMGGTFNPPHEGHVLCAATALKRLRLDRLWWMVSPGNPLKSQANLADFAKRVAMSRALATDPAIEVTAFEARLASPIPGRRLPSCGSAIPGHASSGSWAPTTSQPSIIGSIGAAYPRWFRSPLSTGRAGVCALCRLRPRTFSRAAGCPNRWHGGYQAARPRHGFCSARSYRRLHRPRSAASASRNAPKRNRFLTELPVSNGAMPAEGY